MTRHILTVGRTGPAFRSHEADCYAHTLYLDLVFADPEGARPRDSGTNGDVARSRRCPRQHTNSVTGRIE